MAFDNRWCQRPWYDNVESMVVFVVSRVDADREDVVQVSKSVFAEGGDMLKCGRRDDELRDGATVLNAMRVAT